MKKDNKKVVAFAVLIIGLFLTVIGTSQTYSLYVQGQSFSLDGEAVLVPDIGNIACEKTDRPTPDIYLKPYSVDTSFFGDDTFKTDIEDENGNVIQTRDDLNIYCSAEYDNIYTNECLVEVKRENSNIASTEYFCEQNTFSSVDECTDITLGSIPDNVWTKVRDISRDEAIAVRDFKDASLFSENIEKGELEYRLSRDEYGLISQTDGKKEKFNSCDLRDIVDTQKDVLNRDVQSAESLDKVTGTTLDFGAVINYVIGYSQVFETDRIIQDGNYYTTGGGVKFPIVEGLSGRNYVDIENRVSDSNIICDPAQLFCVDEGTKIDTQFGKSSQCSYEGEVIGWIPSTDSSSDVEKRQCVSGQWETIETKSVPNCSDSEILNQDYICVKGTDRDVEPVDDTQDKSFSSILLLLGGMIGVIGSSAYLKKN